MTTPIVPPVPAFDELHLVDTAEAALRLGEVFSVQPAPTLFELHRVRDVTGISGEGRITTGLVLPYAGGAVMRWSTRRPPLNYPQRVRQVELVDSIAEIMGVHGHGGATRLRLLPPSRVDSATVGPFDHDAPEAFAVVDPVEDITAWGVWWPADGRTVVHVPEVSALHGRRLATRTTSYRDPTHLAHDLPPGKREQRHDIVYLSGRRGRRLLDEVRAAQRETLERARVAYELAGPATLPPLPDVDPAPLPPR